MASNVIVGERAARAAAEGSIAASDPLSALEAAILPHLAAGPCFVSFSGGVDSSLVLAVAVRAARRHGLPHPVAVSLRFAPSAARADERRWQELVVRSLKLADWETISIRHELDYIGPFAQRLLRAHGVLSPANAYAHIPVCRRARGGTLLTGWGGDDVFHLWPWLRASALLRRRATPRVRDALHLGRLVAPRRVRAETAARRTRAASPPWLRPGPRAVVSARSRAEARTEPRGYDRWLPWLVARRQVELGERAFELTAALEGCRIAHPFWDPSFVAALARTAGPLGWSSRREAVAAIASGVLPPELVHRRSWAWFGEAFWGPYTLAFTQRWDGGGVDPELVDEGVLRRVWRHPVPQFRSASLLQQAWLALEGGGGEPRAPA